jgi:glutaredoxin 3|tara:strand:+ start:60 stop:290 length:231 start_codon:yes stop_codon:yes gene_type:complete
MIIEIYSKDNCSFCELAVRKAQRLTLDNASNSYQVFKLNKDFGREELIEKFPTARTFPQIKIDGQPIGGWVEFKEI